MTFVLLMYAEHSTIESRIDKQEKCLLAGSKQLPLPISRYLEEQWTNRTSFMILKLSKFGEFTADSF